MRSLFVILGVVATTFISCGGGGNNPPSNKSTGTEMKLVLNNEVGAFIYQDKYHKDSPENLLEKIYLTEAELNCDFSFFIVNYDTYNGNLDIRNQNRIIQHLIDNNFQVIVGLDVDYPKFAQSNGYYNKEWVEHQKRYIDWIYSKWKSSILGVYIPEELNLCVIFDNYSSYVREVANYAYQKYKYVTVVSPYWNGCSNPNFQYIKDLCNLPFIYCYIQDGVGSNLRSVKEAYNKLTYYSQDIKLYPNVEIFENGNPFHITKDKERLKSQLSSASQFSTFVLYKIP